MSNWWQGTALALATILAMLKVQSVKAIDSNLEEKEISIVKNRWTTLLAQKNPACLPLATNHSKVYAFETRNFCIAICQADDEFFYLRQSRANPTELLILPATAVFGGTVFQAIDGKTVYFVGIDDNGHYSSVMRNDDEVVFEPEIQPPMLELPNSDRPASAFTETIPNIPFLTNSGENPLESDNLDKFDGESDWEMCAQDKSKLHPLLNSWQKLLNAPLKTASDCSLPAKLN